MLALGAVAAAACGHVDFEAPGIPPPPPCDDASLQAGSPWPVQGGCPTHLGRSARSGPHQLAAAWRTAIDGVAGTCSSAVVASDGTIFVGTEDNMAGIVEVASTGGLDWSAQVANMTASAALGPSRLYGGAQQAVVALDYGGNVQWTFGGSLLQVDSSIVLGNDGTLFFGAEDNNIYAVDPDGSERWEFPTGGAIDESPAIAADGTVICGSSDSYVYWLDPVQGSALWSYKLGGYPSTAAIAADGTIYVGGGDGLLYAFDSAGNLQWTFSSVVGAFAVPAIGGDGTIYVGSSNGALYAVTRAGQLRWKLETGSVGGPLSIGEDDTIYALATDGTLSVVSPDGRFLARTSVGAVDCPAFDYPVIGVDGSLYVTTSDGTAGYLVAYAPD